MTGITPLRLSPGKLRWMWERLEGRPSEFSEMSAPDPEQFREAMFTSALSWYEFPDENEEKTRGIVALRYTPGDVNAVVILTLLDRRAGDKVEAFRVWLKHTFALFPVNRLSIEVPDVHFATRRLVDRSGWKREGTRRGGTRLTGRWVNVGLYGLLRSEV